MQGHNQISELIREDKEIDHDKIKKALKYNDDQRFLLNYEKIKSGNPQLLNAKDRVAFEKRQKQLTVCKQLFTQQINRKPKQHMQVLLDNLRNSISQNAVGENSSGLAQLSLKKRSTEGSPQKKYDSRGGVSSGKNRDEEDFVRNRKGA